jgi:hypothetical protein
MTRAMRLASAIATSLTGFLASMPASHGSAAPDLRWMRMRASAPRYSSRRMDLFPIFDSRPIRSLPPLERCFGVSPSHAA